jgi:hypothetical protein
MEAEKALENGGIEGHARKGAACALSLCAASEGAV